MPVYQYQGKHYNLPEGLTKEQAKQRIQTHLAGEQTGKVGDIAKGLGEAALMTGTGGLASVTGIVPAGLSALNDLTQGKPADFENKYASAMQRMTYEPRTEKGQDFGEEVSDFVNRNLIPIAPLAPMGMGIASTMAAIRAARSAKRVSRGIDPAAVIEKVTAEDRPQLTTRKPGAQGNLFPESSEGLASPYDAGMAGVTEPIQPLRQRAQMDLPLGDTPASIAQRPDGVGVLGNENPGMVKAVGDYEAGAPSRNVMNEMAAQVAGETPYHNPPPADAMAWMRQQMEQQGDHAQQQQLFGDMWRDQAMARDRQRAAQAAIEQRNAALNSDVARNVDLNEHGLDRTTLTPDHELTPTGREAMTERQTDVQGQRVLNKTMESMERDPQGARAAQVGPEARPEDIINNQMFQQHVAQQVAEHPLVKAAEERVSRQEQLLIKASEKGRATRTQLERIQRDLANLQEALEKTTENVRGAVSEGKKPLGFNFRKQGGAVNMNVMKDGFQKLKQLADGTWLRAHNDGTMFHIDAMKDGHKIAHVEMAPEYIDRMSSDERNMKAYMTHVREDMRGKGYASEMYKFASELGNDVQRSESQTPMGKAMWDKFHEKGMAKKGVIPRKQMGGIDPKVFEKMFPEFLRSKMRDAEGNLKKFYHGTSKDKDFGEIKPNTRGAWFTDNPEAASSYAKENDSKGLKWVDGKYHEVNTSDRVHEVYLNLENPYKITPEDIQRLNKENYAGAQRDLFAKLRAQGHDGVDFGDGTVVAFKPEGVKSTISPKGAVKSPGKKQQGAIFMRPKDDNARKVLDNIPGIEKTLKGLAPSKWTPADAIDAARSAKDLNQNAVQKLSNIFTKGGQYMIDRSDNNPVIRYGVEQVQESERQTRADIANMLHDKDFGLGAVTRAMTAEEQKNIWTLMNWADLHQHELTPSLLKEHGATEAQMKYVETHRQVMDYAHEQMNKVMETLGKPPVPKRVAYAAMNASGDFRRLVYKDGDVVGIIGSDLRWKTDGLKAELEKKGYTVGEERYMGAKGRQAGDIQREFAQMLEWFAAEDPRVAQLLDTVAEVTSSMARNFMNMEVHTKAKKGIFGMDGRKAVDGMEWGGSVLTRDKQLANAREGLKAQMNYAEMAIKWGHLSEAAKNVKEVLSSPEIADKQPMAKQWTQDYLAHSMGYNPTFGRHLEEYAAKAIGATGVGYSVVREGVAVSRRVVNSVLLGLNPGFWYTNVIQPLQSMPGMRSYLVSKGLDASFDLGTGYSYVGKGGIDAFKAAYEPGKLSGDLKDAYNYARTHHVYGSDLIEHSNHIHKGFSYNAERVSSAVAGNIESSTRATMYYSFVRMLRENGMTKENGLHETAHNLTDMTMNNYSRTDRPQVYDMMGPVGETASNLASYKHNELSRVAMFAREALDGNAKPMVAQLLAGLFYTGVKGTIAYNSADWLVKQISAFVGHPVSLTKGLMEVSQMVGGKVAPYALSHGAFSLLGIDMANRLGLGDALIPNVFPGGSKLAQIAGRAYDTIKNPNEANTKELIREASPGIATGVQDLTWFSKGDLGSRRSDLAGSVKRTKTDKIVKAIGLTGINESTEKQKLYENKWINETYTDMRKNTIDTMKGEIYMKGAPSSASIQKYLNQRGDVRGLLKEIERISKEQNMSARDRDLLRASTMKSVQAMEHMKDLQESFK